MPPTSEAPPSNEVPAVKGVAAEEWRNSTCGMLTTKAESSMTTKTANVTAKAAEMATETPSEAAPSVSCRHSRWSERQTQNDRRR